MAVIGATAPAAAQANSTCQLRAPYQHVVYVQFDNAHLRRDNPNVPSDLEQIPALKSFIESNGALLSNDHTILISHTAGGIVSSLTGLYPSNNGITVSNSTVQFNPDGSVAGFPLDRPHQRNRSGTEPGHDRRQEHPGSVGAVHPRRL